MRRAERDSDEGKIALHLTQVMHTDPQLQAAVSEAMQPVIDILEAHAKAQEQKYVSLGFFPINVSVRSPPHCSYAKCLNKIKTYKHEFSSLKNRLTRPLQILRPSQIRRLQILDRGARVRRRPSIRA